MKKDIIKEDCYKALKWLFIATDNYVANDVNERVFRYIHKLEKITEDYRKEIFNNSNVLTEIKNVCENEKKDLAFSDKYYITNLIKSTYK